MKASERVPKHCREELPALMQRHIVPDHLHDGLVRWICDGIMPGSFLQCVLCNDLLGAVTRQSGYGLSHIVRFLIAEAPAGCYGSRERVLAWTTTPDRLEV